MNKSDIKIGMKVRLSEGAASYEGTIAKVYGKLGVVFEGKDSPGITHPKLKQGTTGVVIRFMSKKGKFQGSHGCSNGVYDAPIVVEEILA